MKFRSKHRAWLILLIALILLCCTASAVLSLRSGRTVKAISTFFAGVTFALLIAGSLRDKRS